MQRGVNTNIYWSAAKRRHNTTTKKFRSCSDEIYWFLSFVHLFFLDTKSLCIGTSKSITPLEFCILFEGGIWKISRHPFPINSPLINTNSLRPMSTGSALLCSCLTAENLPNSKAKFLSNFCTWSCWQTWCVFLPICRIEKRSKYSRRRTFDEDEDIDYINERNMNFNKKLERFYGKYTAEIKQNLERGTAV